ncbi:MAG: Grx4 family monothiol glutaredoxin [Deltaproteobacteria bacterium]|nr:Grx4 family monothiol glutaredoxin [Deltaproteobacteria bacterium]
MSDVRQQIDELIHHHKVVLFMKGTRSFPQCGFSARAIEIFKRCGVQVKDVNVLADPTMRQGIKDYSNWPTIPQAYIAGQFVGGSDILLEMYESGELQKLLGVETPAAPPATAPRLTVTEAAARAFQAATPDAGPNDVLRLDVSPTFQVDLFFGPTVKDDFVVESAGLRVHVAPGAAARVDGVTIDFVEGPNGAGFRVDNPNEPPKVKTMTVRELKAKLDAGEALHLFDVRTDRERATASIAAARPLDDKALAGLAKDAPIVLHCHHGMRSRSAAERLLQDGFRNVYNLTGGIDAWSAEVDPSVPRY